MSVSNLTNMKPLFREIDKKYIEVIGHYDNPVLCAKLTLLADLYAIEHKEGYALFDVKDYDKFGMLDEKLEFSVSDLTNTIWVFKNSGIVFPSSLSDNTIEYNLSFESSGNNYLGLLLRHAGASEAYYIEYMLTFPFQSGETKYVYNVWEDYSGGSYWSTFESGQSYRIIKITGGTDVTNASLISWLEANATQVQVDDLTNTKWVFKNNGIVFPSLLGTSRIEYNLSFTSNSINYLGFYLQHSEGSEVYFMAYMLTFPYDAGQSKLVYEVLDDYSSGNYWNFTGSGQEYRLISITGGSDVSNPDLLVWLSQNATQIQVDDLTGTKWVLNNDLSNATTFTSIYYAYIEKLTCIQVSTGNIVEIDLMYNDAPGYFDRHTTYKVLFVNGDYDSKCWWDTSNNRYNSRQYGVVKSIMFEITGGTDATNPDLLVWLNNNATLVPVVDLSGTEWVFNESPDLGNEEGPMFYINFTSNSEIFESIAINFADDGYLGYTYVDSYMQIAYDRPGYTSGTVGWLNQNYKTISITNGTDATNPDLIAWLTENATYQSQPVTPTITYDLTQLQLSAGTHTIQVKARASGYRDSEFSNSVSYSVSPQQVSDLTGTSWLFNNVIDHSLTDNSFSINFENGIGWLYSGMYIEYNAGEIIQYTTNGRTDTVYDESRDGWLNLSLIHNFIKITGGNDATNQNLINWLYANATLMTEHTVKIDGADGNGETVYIQINDDPTWYYAILVYQSGFGTNNIPNALGTGLIVIPNVTKIKIGTGGDPTSYSGPYYSSSSTGDLANLTFTSTGSSAPAYATGEITMTQDSNIYFDGNG